MAYTFNRRDLLMYGGAAIAGVTLGETGRRWLARVDERINISHPPAAETWAVSVCRECPAACGLRVRLMDGVPVKLDGNPSCPVSRGRLCAKGQAALESYFDPDRIVGPARRSGRRGEGRWTKMSWPEAIAYLASHLNRARADGGAVLALAAAQDGPIDEAWTRFWTALHGHVGWTPPRTAARLAPRLAALTGATADPVFDLEHATHVLSFGAPIVEDWLSPVWAQRSFGRFRRGGSRPRGRLVQIDARRSPTARKADEWLPVASDRQAFLAYGVASVLLREDRVDRERLAGLGGNIGEFERDTVARYTPDAVGLATGVPVVTLLRLARELTSTAQPLVAVNADAPPDLVDAVFALNALIGAIDRQGGVLQAAAPASSRGDHSAVDALSALARHPDPSAVVVFRDASPLRTLGLPEDVDAALERCSLVVSLSPYLDEAAAMADLLLPSHTALESWQAIAPPPADGAEKLACARPAAIPRLDTRDVISTLKAVAQELGGPALDAAPFASSEDVIKAELNRVWTRRRGALYADSFETNWTLQLEQGGWWVPPAASSATFTTAALDAGGWLDPYFAPGQLTALITRRGGLTFVPPAAQAPESADANVPPAVVPAALDLSTRDNASSQPEWPLRLVTFTPAEVNVAGGPNQPVLFELLGQPDGSPWRVWAELDGATAAEHGVRNGATVRITSASGSIDVLAVIVDGTPPGTIAVPFVPALPTGGRWARLVSADVRRLLGRDGTAQTVRVRVTAT